MRENNGLVFGFSGEEKKNYKSQGLCMQSSWAQTVCTYTMYS
jgi:hypothetical protein